MYRSIAILIVLSAAYLFAMPADGFGQTVSADVWRRIPVQESGRRKPLDTVAWESLQKATGRTSFQDPKTGEKLDHAAWYLTMLFDWQGWSQPANRHGMIEPMNYSAGHQPDRWDHAKILPVGNSQLR